jgi:hypothetical protein
MMRLPFQHPAGLLPAVLILAWCSWCPAAILTGGHQDDEHTSIVYDAGTGEIRVDAPLSTELTSINIDSASSMFSGTPQNLGGTFDNFAPNNVFKATFGGSFGSLSFGFIAPPGLGEAAVASDLTVVGSLDGGGGLGDVDLVYITDQPAQPARRWRLPVCGPGIALPMLAMGLLWIITTGRERRSRQTGR